MSYTLEICIGDCEFSGSQFIKFNELSEATIASEILEKSEDVLYTDIQENKKK